MKTRAVFGLTAVAVFLLACPSFSEGKLILGVHPYLPATEIYERFGLLADYLSEKTGTDIEVRVSRNYAEHIVLVGENEYDIAYMGPASYVEMGWKFGKKPILGKMEIGGKSTFAGYIVVAEKSDIKTIADLDGRSFAFGDPDSTMSHLVPRHMLVEAGIDINSLSKFQFMTNHENVALGVLMGEFDAGALKPETFDKYKARGLRALAATPEVSEHVFVARSDMSADEVKKFSALFQGLRDSDEGRGILRKIHNKATAVVPAKYSDYENLRIILRELREAGVEF